jgi:hypothetical protein
MNREDIIRMAREAGLVNWEAIAYANDLKYFASLVAKQQREEDAKLVESMTLEWPDQPEFAQVERTTIQDCAKIIRQRAVTYD